MAFLSELTAQTEELVSAVTWIPTDDASFGSLRDATLRSLRQHTNLRTNQFEVEAQLDGLVERFAVAGRDALADALAERRARLAGHATPWTPDVLHFLLELSDRPADAASLDALHALCASRTTYDEAPLRWEDIAREDGWGSDGDAYASNASDASEADDMDDMDTDDINEDDQIIDDDTTATSIDTPGEARGPELDEQTRRDLAALLASVRESQSWRAHADTAVTGADTITRAKHPLSELQVVRESLFRLQGLSTTLFGDDGTPSDAFRLSDVSLGAHRSLLGSVAAAARALAPLRARVASSESAVPLLQVFDDAVRRRLLALDRQLSDVHARFVDIQGPVRVSLAAVLAELQPMLTNLSALAVVVARLDTERNAHAFRYLELLHDAAAAAQAEGAMALYEYLGTVFFECFQVYLRPIRTWMEDGRLLDGDRVFFVAGARAPVPHAQIWHTQYRLLRTASGVLHAPRFLHPAASRIFTTGKSIVVLRRLGTYEAFAKTPEPALDFATVCPPDTRMAPFAQLFEDAFARWIQSKHHAASATLQATLFDACGLWASLDALHAVYLSADGAATDAFVSRVFDSLDSRHPRWHDAHAMTEFAREAFAGRLEAHRVSVALNHKPGDADNSDNSDGPDDPDDPDVARRSVRAGIARIRLTYCLSWPVQIVVPAASMASYQAVHTLVVQIRRASSVLSQHRLLDDAMAADDATHGDARDRGRPTGTRALYFALRARLLWVCTTLQSYLATLVVAPRVAALHADLPRAVDVDAMAAVHAAFLRGLVADACLGERLGPIHEGLLDVLDLALRLADAHRDHAAREASALHETWRLSVLASPQAKTGLQTPARRFASPLSQASVRRRLFGTPRRDSPVHDHDHEYDDDMNDDMNDMNDDDDSGSDDADNSMVLHFMNRQQLSAPEPAQGYADTLHAISGDLDSALRFVTGGLRAAARASSDATTAAKWDILAEMLGGGQAI